MTETINQIRSKAIDFDMPIDWAIHKKKDYIKERLSEIETQKKTLSKYLIKPTLNKTERELIFQSLTDIKKWEKDLINYHALLSRKFKSYKINDDMIRIAKEYPIEKLVDVQKGKALCINHKDTNPSMDCRKNFAHCYVCGETWDTIDIVMKTKNLPFNEAVIFLNQ